MLNTEEVGTKCISHKTQDFQIVQLLMCILYHYNGDEKKINLEEIDMQYDHFT